MTPALLMPMADFVRDVQFASGRYTYSPSCPWIGANPVALGEDAVSVHVYCRPHDECDLYDVEQGTVRRARLAYDSSPRRGRGVSSRNAAADR